MTGYAIQVSNPAEIGKNGSIYVPQCFRHVLPATLFAVVENKMYLGKCVSFRPKKEMPIAEEVKIASDGYLFIKKLYGRAEIKPPFIWRSFTSIPGSIEELVLFEKDHAEIPNDPETNKKLADFLARRSRPSSQ